MIRIVAVQRSENVTDEFILIQNQGSLRCNLRGLALVSDMTLEGYGGGVHVLTDDVGLHPGQYAVLKSCIGPSRWVKNNDGSMVYYTYLGGTTSLWTEPQPIHLLAPQHTYVERSTEPYLV